MPQLEAKSNAPHKYPDCWRSRPPSSGIAIKWIAKGEDQTETSDHHEDLPGTHHSAAQRMRSNISDKLQSSGVRPPTDIRQALYKTVCAAFKPRVMYCDR
ncbi:hypothetical protein C2E23DRAFT_798817 [Lenzites betulinus]|nr:hypothetical protein C2E23DRAFT_798817 [Lenzites betulinus]